MAIPYNKDRHDIGILRQDGTTSVGFMLARQKNGVPIYSVDDDEYLAQQQTQQAGYSGLPYEKELRLGQDDWRGGFGQEIYDSNDPKKYLYSQDVDCRFSHKIIPSPADTSFTFPLLATIVDGGMEVWTNATTLTNWAKDTCTLAQGTAANKYTDTYSARVTTDAGGDPNKAGGIYQSLGNITNILGKVFYFKAWCKTNTANACELAIKTDGSGGATTYSSYHTGGNAWEQLTATVTIPADATYVKVYCYARSDGGGSNQSGYFDTATIPAYGNSVTKAQFNSAYYFSSGDCLLKLTAAGAISLVQIFLTSVLSIKGFTDCKMYIALGASYPYQYMSTAEVFTTSNAVVHHFYLFEWLDANSPTMYGSDSTNTIRSTTDPTNGGTAWSAQTTVDSTEYPITCLLSTAGSLYVMKSNKPYYLDVSGNVKVLTDITETLYTATYSGGAGSHAWLGKIYMPYGVQSLLEYDTTTDTLQWIQPSLYTNGVSLSKPYALIGDDQYLYCVIRNDSSKTYIIAGRYENIDGASQWVWHTLSYHATLGRVYSVGIFTGTSSKWLLLGSSSTTIIDAYYVTQNYGDLTGSEVIGYFHNGGTVYTAWLHGEFKADTKALLSLTVHLGHTYAADAYWTVSYQLWGSASWVSLGNLVGTATDRSHTLFFSSSTRPSTPFIRFKFVAAVGAAYAPILLDYSVKCILYPTRRNIYKMVVYVSDGIRDRQNQPLLGKKDLKDTLTEAKDTATSPIVWYDIDGNTKYGRILSAAPFYELEALEAGNKTTDGKTTVEVCNLSIQEIKYS